MPLVLAPLPLAWPFGAVPFDLGGTGDVVRVGARVDAAVRTGGGMNVPLVIALGSRGTGLTLPWTFHISSIAKSRLISSSKTLN